MLPVCSAFAYASELSERTFAATAALIGAAMFALISDIAARSGSSSPAMALSSSRDSWRYSATSFFFFPISCLLRRLGRLSDVAGLLRVRVCDRVVAQHVQRVGGIHRRGDVRVDQRHRGSLRQLLAGDSVQLLVGEQPVLLGLVAHAMLLLRRYVD